MMKKNRRVHWLFGILLYAVTTVVHTEEIGLGAATYTSPFKGDKNNLMLWPIIDIDTGYFFIKNFSAGVHLFQDTDQKVNLLVQYWPFHLKPSKNSNHSMTLLNRRRSTLLSGISYNLITNFGDIDAAVLNDVLNNSHSLIASLNYTCHLTLNQEAILSPVIGVVWVNKKHNQYYYGVNTSESQRTGIPRYNPNDGFNYDFGFDFRYSLDGNWTTHFDYRYVLLKDKVKSSPITKHDYSHLLMVGVSYTF